MLTQGRIREGADFMASVSDTWTGLNSFMVTHNWWHQALFLLEQDQHDAALHLYDTQVWGVVKDYSQDQINAISLLVRLELAGVNVGDRWADVARHLAAREQDQVLPFLDLQYLLGLGRAGEHAAAARLLAHIEAHAASRKACARPPRAAFKHLYKDDGATPPQAWARPCPSWWRLAAAMHSVTCSASCTCTLCSATGNGHRPRTCCSRSAMRSRNRCGWRGKCTR